MKKDILLGSVVGFVATSCIVLLAAVNHKPTTEVVTEQLYLPELLIKSYPIERASSEMIEENVPFILNRDLQCMIDKKCKLLAEVIYYEARGEPTEGQIAVGWVVMNRLKSERFPDTMTKVVSNKCHFSYKCDGSMKKGIKNEDAYEKAKFIADNILRGNFADPTNGADHYLNPNKVKKLPAWAKEYPKVAVIANHHFHIWK